MHRKARDRTAVGTLERKLGSRARVFLTGTLLATALALLFSAAESQAQGRVVTISEVTIVGRVQKPIAAVDVSRIQPKLTLAELRQTFTDRVERALYRSPL